MSHVYFILPAILVGGLVFGWIFARWLETRYDRVNQASSEELLDELETAYGLRRSSIELRTPFEFLPRVFGCMLDKIDSGFGEKHARQMIQRIETPGPRHALYPIRVNGIRSELELQWSRDADGRVRLLVLAVPNVIRALKRQAKRLPRPVADDHGDHAATLTSGAAVGGP